MALELENIDNLVTDDLDLRNRNWGVIDDSLELKADKTYVDNLSASKADLSEIEDARGTEATLGARLDSTDTTVASHLANIVQTTEVNSSTKYPSSAVTYGLAQDIRDRLPYRDQASPISDCNTAPEGVCTANTNTDNTPKSGHFCLLTFTVRNINYRVQIAINDDVATGGMYLRHKYVGDWQEWKEVAFT